MFIFQAGGGKNQIGSFCLQDKLLELNWLEKTQLLSLKQVLTLGVKAYL